MPLTTTWTKTNRFFFSSPQRFSTFLPYDFSPMHSTWPERLGPVTP